MFAGIVLLTTRCTLLIPPTLQIHARRRALHDAIDDLGGVELMSAEPGDRVWARMITTPAVLGAGFESRLKSGDKSPHSISVARFTISRPLHGLQFAHLASDPSTEVLGSFQ